MLGTEPSKVGPILFPNEMCVQDAFIVGVWSGWTGLNPGSPNAKIWQGRDPNQLGFSEAPNISKRMREEEREKEKESIRIIFPSQEEYTKESEQYGWFVGWL